MSQVIDIVTYSRFILPGAPDCAVRRTPCYCGEFPTHLLLCPLPRTADIVWNFPLTSCSVVFTGLASGPEFLSHSPLERMTLSPQWVSEWRWGDCSPFPSHHPVPSASLELQPRTGQGWSQLTQEPEYV